MSTSWKDVAAIGSLFLSATALVTSYLANQKAQQLDELVFRAETVNHLLKEVHDNTTKAEDVKDRTASCLYAGALAKAEELVVTDTNHRLVGRLFLSQVERGLLPQNCVLGTLELLSVNAEATAPQDAVKEVKLDDDTREIGKYHALVASYPAVASECGHAKDDVVEFAPLLANKGLDGKAIYVARTVKSESYAVTVDLGDDRNLATEAMQLIRSVSSQSADKRTGHDSFVQVNSDWYIDASCSEVKVIGG